MPEKATEKATFPAKFVCQQFRGNQPVTVEMLQSCFDPEKYKVTNTRKQRHTPSASIHHAHLREAPTRQHACQLPITHSSRYTLNVRCLV